MERAAQATLGAVPVDEVEGECFRLWCRLIDRKVYDELSFWWQQALQVRFCFVCGWNVFDQLKKFGDDGGERERRCRYTQPRKRVWWMM